MVRVVDPNDEYPSQSFGVSTGDFTGTSGSVEQHTDNLQASSQTFICIITDLTDASNTCKRHVINLSGSYTVEYLIQEAANFYMYEPWSFNLCWKSTINNEMINLTEIDSKLEKPLSLIALGLTQKKNTFEIHEKDGPPIQQKPSTDLGDSTGSNDFYGYKNNSMFNNISAGESNILEPVNYTSLMEGAAMTGTYPPRRHAISTQCDSSSMGLTIPSSFYTGASEEENTGFVGLINQAMTCYLNSLLQTLYMTPEFRNGIYRWQSTTAESDNDVNERKNIPLQLQRLFLNLQTSEKRSIQTHDLTKSFGWNSEDAFQQHDVQELSRVMFDALEKMFKGTQQKNLINELYQGRVKDYVKCLECNTESARVDVYLDVPLCIRPFGSDKTFSSVEEALDAFVQPEILDENNKYFCSKCDRKCKAHKGLKFESFPYILSLQLKRFDFDYNTMSRFKLSNSVSFPETLNVKKYLDESTEEVGDSTHQELENVNINEKTDANSSDISVDECKIKTMDENNTSNTDDQSNNDKDDGFYEYELYSIMIHSGSATGGHYYAYIKCFEKDQWYNFNDEKVTKLDRHEICKAFGTSYSIYSSATAYMLLYRQKNAQRNEKFIRTEEFSEHITETIEKFRKQQIEADLLKEYMDNVCKVKVFVANQDFESDADLALHGTIDGRVSCLRRREKIVNVHKDLTLDKAKVAIIKEFGLAYLQDQLKSIESGNKKCRLLKYDTYNDLIEQSYKKETETTVFEAVGYTKFPYNFCWYLEIVPSDQEFIEYHSNEYKVKVINLNLETLDTVELFFVRLNDDARVSCLRERIAEKLNNCDPLAIRMALEKSNSIYNYVYLNDNIDDLLRSLNFTRVCKVFIETEEKPSADTNFLDTRFFYALDATANMIQMSVYLPNDEQCELFKLKTKRRLDYIELQNQLIKKSKILSSNRSNSKEEDDECEDLISLSDINVSENASESATIVPTAPDANEFNMYLGERNYSTSLDIDTSSKMSTATSDESQQQKISRQLDQTNYDELDSNMVENHFKSLDSGAKVDMETSLEDEGIGSSTKSRSNSLETIKADNKANNQGGEFCSSTAQSGGFQHPHIFIENENNMVDEEDDNETHLGDVVERCDSDLEELDSYWTDVDNNNADNINIDDDDNLLGCNEYSNEATAANETEAEGFNGLFNFENNQYESLYTNSSDLVKQRVKFCDTANKSKSGKSFESDIKADCEMEPLKVPDSLNIFSNNTNKQLSYGSENGRNDTGVGSSRSGATSTSMGVERFIKSHLNVNKDLGTRILEVKMDKRIDLNEFKSHTNDYLKISNENFRVFRICQNDLECELTAHENQFSYLTQYTKFLVKLGPPLRYGEYVLPVYKLNRALGNISYLCDFMIVHGLSVLNHKELLKDDLKEECNLEVNDVSRLRLRKKVGKRPGNILIDGQVFGKDLFVNPTTELCIEILEEPEKKLNSKLQTSVYLRHWKSAEYELGDLIEVVVNSNTFEVLLSEISRMSDIVVEDLEILKCKRNYPFRSPILEIHNDPNWKMSFYLQMEKLEDGVCFYYRDKNLNLGDISEEKRRDMAKTDNLNFRPISNYTSRKETGVRIQVENN